MMKKSFIVSIILILYAYAARAFGIYFFWESGYIGWLLLFCVAIFFCAGRIRIKRSQEKKVWLEKVCIAIAGMVIFAQLLLLFLLPGTDAFKTAKRHIVLTKEIMEELGEIHSFYAEPVGSMNISSSAAGSTGAANILVIAKGEKRFGEYELLLIKQLESG